MPLLVPSVFTCVHQCRTALVYSVSLLAHVPSLSVHRACVLVREHKCLGGLLSLWSSYSVLLQHVVAALPPMERSGCCMFGPRALWPLPMYRWRLAMLNQSDPTDFSVESTEFKGNQFKGNQPKNVSYSRCDKSECSEDETSLRGDTLESETDLEEATFDLSVREFELKGQTGPTARLIRRTVKNVARGARKRRAYDHSETGTTQRGATTRTFPRCQRTLLSRSSSRHEGALRRNQLHALCRAHPRSDRQMFFPCVPTRLLIGPSGLELGGAPPSGLRGLRSRIGCVGLFRVALASSALLRELHSGRSLPDTKVCRIH